MNHSRNILYLFDLVQDLDLLLPLVRETRFEKSLSPVVCVTDRLLQHSPRVGKSLKALDLPLTKVPRRDILVGFAPPLDNVMALVVACESTASAHLAPHRLVARANQSGIATFTLQHGYENIGLTYFDNDFPAETTDFASQHILTWGSLERLHPSVKAGVKARCIPVGCPKDIMVSPPKFENPADRPYVVSVFENLHWTRFDAEQRSLFLCHLRSMAMKFTDTTIIVKPHHDECWIVRQPHDELRGLKNLVIAHPKRKQWEPFTATGLLAISDAVITTPSTVALDAARAGLPVALFAEKLILDNYSPLTMLKRADDWFLFVRGTRIEIQRRALIRKSQDFVRAVLMPEPVLSRILHVIKEKCAMQEKAYAT
ncbi:MAG: hypothetical protein Q8R76_08390 [Candidatus Omnitrophota bacterium]|nr:hypothetical protein [Candidatus Omnitrophota bacterium]